MSAEKTEQPTAKKLRDARRQGQVVKSKEIVSSALILSLVALLMGFSDYYLEHLGKLLLLPAEYIDLPFRQALETILENLLQELLYLLAPVLLVAALVVVLSHVGQYGFLLSLDSVKPDLKKINPVEGAKKIFSIRSLVEFLKSTLKVALLSLLVWLTLQGNLASLLRIPACGLDCVAPVSGLMLRQLMLVCAVGFLAIAVADYAFERHQHYKQLRMSKDEVKREYKEMEGSPEIKSKRRQFHQELQSSNLRADVRRSSVIVANPTHVAIGIRYRRGETPLPLITLKHTDALALRVRRIAEEEGNPGAATSSAGTGAAARRQCRPVHTGGPDPGHRRSPALAGKPADGYTLNAIGQGGRLGTGNARRCDLAPKRGPKAPFSCLLRVSPCPVSRVPRPRYCPAGSWSRSG